MRSIFIMCVCCIDSVCGGPFNSYDFFGARGRGEGETLSRHVVSTQCAVGLRMFLSTLYIFSSNNLNMLFLIDPKMSSLFITPERA